MTETTTTPPPEDADAGWFQPLFDWLWDLVGTAFALILSIIEHGFYKIATWGLVLVERFVNWAADSGMLPRVDFGALPGDALLLIAYLKVPTAFSILLAGMALRMVRKGALRF